MLADTPPPCTPFAVSEKAAANAIDRYLFPTAKARASAGRGYGFMQADVPASCCTSSDASCAWVLWVGYHHDAHGGCAGHFEHTETCTVHAHTGEVRCGFSYVDAPPPNVVGNALDGGSDATL